MMALFSRLSILVPVLAVSPAWAHPIWTNEPSGMTALQAVIAAHPGKFVSCIRTTGNVLQLNCTP